VARSAVGEDGPFHRVIVSQKILDVMPAGVRHTIAVTTFLSASPTPPRDAAGEPLLRWLRADTNEEPEHGDRDWSRLVDLAAQQRVSSILLSQLTSDPAARPAPPAALGALAAEARRLGVRNLGFQRDLAVILGALDTAGVPAILLKGAHLARKVYRHAGLREMNDLDLLIRPADAVRAANTLQSLGYQFLTPYTPSSTYTGGPHHLPRMMKPGAAPVELHLTLAPSSGLLKIDVDGLWRRAVPLEPRSRHFTLCPEDLLLHICAHSAYPHSGEFGLRPLCDVDQIVRAFPALDWTGFCDRAREWRATRGTFMTLHLAVSCLGASVPGWVLDSLRPADFTDSLAEVIHAHLFTPKPLSLSVSVEATRTFGFQRFHQRLAHALRRVFVARQTLASHYPAATSRFPAWYYAKRALSLVGRYAWLPASVARGHDPELRALIHRRNVIVNWLEREARD